MLPTTFPDAAGSIVALISTRVAQKPVDAEHPFGHGRMEYLGSLGVGLLILLMAVSLLFLTAWRVSFTLRRLQ